MVHPVHFNMIYMNTSMAYFEWRDGEWLQMKTYISFDYCLFYEKSDFVPLWKVYPLQLAGGLPWKSPFLRKESFAKLSVAPEAPIVAQVGSQRSLQEVLWGCFYITFLPNFIARSLGKFPSPKSSAPPKKHPLNGVCS